MWIKLYQNNYDLKLFNENYQSSSNIANLLDFIEIDISLSLDGYFS